MTQKLHADRQRCAEIIRGDWYVQEIGQDPRLRCRGSRVMYVVSARSGRTWTATAKLAPGADHDDAPQTFQVKKTVDGAPEDALQALVETYGEALDALFGSRHPEEQT